MTIYRVTGTAATVSGKVSWNTLDIPGGMLRQIIIEPTTSTNIYDFQMVNDNSFTVVPTQVEPKSV